MTLLYNKKLSNILNIELLYEIIIKLMEDDKYFQEGDLKRMQSNPFPNQRTGLWIHESNIIYG